MRLLIEKLLGWWRLCRNRCPVCGSNSERSQKCWCCERFVLDDGQKSPFPQTVNRWRMRFIGYCHSISSIDVIGSRVRVVPEIILPAISVINGSKESVIFVRLPKGVDASEKELNRLKKIIDESLTGSSLEGAKILVMTGDVEIEIVNADELEKV